MRMIAASADSDKLARASRARTDPYLVPAFVGLGAPYWDAGARGAIVGITRGTNRADVVRAALDSIAYQVRDALAAMEKDSGRRVRELRVDGGATANSYLMQFQADVLGRPVRRPKMAETTALGAAMLAGLAVGMWKSAAALDKLRQGGKVYRSKMRAELRDQLLAGWRDANFARPHAITDTIPGMDSKDQRPTASILFPEQYPEAARALGRAFIMTHGQGDLAGARRSG